MKELKTTKKSKHYVNYTQIIIMFILLCVFFYYVPYTDDDLRWGSQSGLDRLANRFAGYGGRYLGYLIVMALTRSTLFKVLFMSTVVTLMAYLVRYITTFRTAPSIVILSIMVAPLSMFSSTMGWVSGFANYVTSICFTLVYFAYIKYFEDSTERKQSFLLLIPMLLLGGINTLIVEHYTIYHVLLGVLTVIFFAVKYKCIFIQFVGYAIGAIAGAVFMFSNSAYHNVVSGEDSYRSVGLGGLLQNIASGLAKICTYGYMENIVLNITIFVTLYLIVHKYKYQLHRTCQFVAEISLFLHFGCLMACHLMPRVFEKKAGISNIVYVIPVGASLLAILSLIIIVALFAKQFICFRNILFLLISIIILNGPFLLANPVTPRVFFGTYILFAVILCILLEQLCSDIRLFSEEHLCTLCKTGLVVGAVFYIGIFSLIHKADMNRLNTIKKQAEAGKESVVLYKLPYEQFVHDITVYKKWELDGYKQFYNLPGDLNLLPDKKNK